ncbi:MAG: parallel beta-helix domain-containing protein [Planctomycetaceae bacterium]
MTHRFPTTSLITFHNLCCNFGTRTARAALSLALFAVMGFRAVSAADLAGGSKDEAFAPSEIVLKPSEDVQFRLQSALINAVPGDVIVLAEGTYRFESELNVASDRLTIRGAGQDKTILSFRNQQAGSSGIVATGNGFVIEDLSVQDTAGNAVKVLSAKDVTFRNLTVEWTDGPKSSNGAYGIYPVECQNVLIENCTSIAASDAGIYVGQSHDVVVRNCRAERNVAGIEIENTVRADVYDNTAVNNTGGILVFDLPGLNVVNGGQVRVFRNQIENNNHENFAPKGTMVADVPSGTGLMLMATDNVEIFDNDIENNQTSGILVVSFLVTQRKFKDPNYDAFPEAVSIHNNRISRSGHHPQGQLGTLVGPVLGGTMPDIFYDGILNPSKLVDGQLPADQQLSVLDNADATFVNVRLNDLTPENVLTGKYRFDRDSASFRHQRRSLPEVQLTPHSKESRTGSEAVKVYRSAPQLLSGWKLLTLTDGHWQPAADLLTYELNTPLFSDYTLKHRSIRLPEGQSMQWNETDVFDFPVGTVIAKTFSYPDDTADASAGERFLETRIEHRETTGWYGYSYIWNDEQTDATLQLGGGVMDVEWTDSAGKHHQNRYQIPNANQCVSCHSQNEVFVPLGPTARNLNRSCSEHDSRNQLTAWIEGGRLKGAPESRPRLAVFDDVHSGSLDQRARAWLEVNCAHCHNPLGSARTSGLDLRTVQQEPARYGVFKSPVAAGKGSGGRTYDIVPGKPEESILMYRLETDEPGARMPSLARGMNHIESNALIREWIRSLPEEDAPKGK